MATPFSINHLDHVAIVVENMETTIDWYQKVLGLTRISPADWNGVPVMLFANGTGVAVFPKKKGGDRSVIKFIDHFAFNIDLKEMNAARKHLLQIGIPHTFKDHTYYHSIYFKDPDNHTVELTALVKDPV